MRRSMMFVSRRAWSERWGLFAAAIACASLCGLGCGSPKEAAPATPAPQTPTEVAAAPPKEAAPPAVAKPEADLFEKLMHELDVARQPGIYFTVKKLERPDLLPYLVKAQADPQQRARIALALQKLIERDGDGTAAGALHIWVIPDQVPSLIEFMEKRAKFEKEILTALSMIKDPRSVKAVAKLFPKYRGTVSAAFVRLGGELAGDAVLPYIHFEEIGVRSEGRRLIGVLGVKPNAVLDQTLLDLKSDIPKRRWAACDWLLKFDPKDPRRAEFARALEPLITDTAGEVNRRSIPALLRVVDADSIPPLVAFVLDRKNKFARKDVVLHLGKSKDPRAVAAIVGDMDSDNWAAAQAAVLAMGAPAEMEVCKLLKDEKTALRVRAVKALQEIGTEKSVPALKLALEDKHPSVRSTTKTALQRIAERTK